MFTSLQPAVNLLQVIGFRETIDPSRESIHRQLQKIFPSIWQSFDVIFLPNVHFQCCMILQGTLGGNFDLSAASGESTAWVLFWKTRSRPIGVRVCLVAQFNFSVPHLIRVSGQWVVLRKGNSGRQPQLITPENEGEDNTNYPSPRNFSFFDNPDVPFGPRGPPAPPEPHEPPGLPGLPPGWPPAPSPAGGGEQVGTGNTSRERLPLRPSPPEPEPIPIPMSDDEDDQPPQEERQRQRSRSRERV